MTADVAFWNSKITQLDIDIEAIWLMFGYITFYHVLLFYMRCRSVITLLLYKLCFILLLILVMAMDWAVDTTGLIITSVTCCGQGTQSVSDTFGGRSGTRSCWYGGPDLRRSRLASNSWMRRTSNFSTADLHVERQPVLSIASVSSSDGVMPHWVIVVFRQSLYSLYCPPGRRKPWWSCP